MVTDTGIYFRTVVNTYFCFLTCPFRLGLRSLGSRNSFYIAKSYLPHKVMCAIILLLGLLNDIQSFLNVIPQEKDRKNPAKYFFFVTVTLGQIHRISSMWQLWFRQQTFVNVLNLNLNDDIKNVSLRKLSLKYSILFPALVFMFVGMGLSSSLFAAQAFIPTTEKSTHWSFATWWNAMVQNGWKMFFMSGDKTNLTTPIVEKQAYSGIDIFMGLLGTLGYYMR